MLYIVSLATFLRSFGQVIYAPSLAQMRFDLNTSTALVGLSLSVYGMVLALSQVGAGPLVDRFDARRVQLIGLAIFSGASFAGWLTGGIGLLLLVRGLQALGIASAASVGIAYISDFYPAEEQGRATAVFEVFNAAGVAAAPALGAGVAVLFGWRADFLLLALLGALVVAGTVLAVPANPAAGTRVTFDDFLGMGRLVATRSALLSGFAAFFALYSVHTVYPIFLADRMGWGEWGIGIILTVLPLAAIAGSLFGGAVGDRIGSLQALKLGSSAMVLAFLLLTGASRLEMPPGTWLRAGLPTALCGVTVGFSLPVQMKIMLENFPKLRGTAGAVQYSARFLGASVAPALTGFLVDAASPNLALASAAAVLLLGALSVAQSNSAGLSVGG